MIRLSVFTFLFIALPFLARSQSFYNVRKNRELIVTAGSGVANYFGDLVNPHSLGKVKPSLLIGTEYFFSNRISGRAELTWFQLKGSDANANDDRRERNLSFISNNIELNVAGTINLLPLGHRFYQRPVANIYGFLGVGVLYFNPKADYNGRRYALQPLETEGKRYSRFTPIIPLGLGLKFKVGPYFNVLVEMGYRITFTDHLDDVSATRYTQSTLLKSDLSRSLADRRIEGYQSRGEKVPGTYSNPPKDELYKIGKRGNPDQNDSYLLLSAKLQFYLPYHFYHSNMNKLYNQKRKAIYKKFKRGQSPKKGW